ncbi:MAG: YkgJ family cysteine cluster protein [Archangium sp.]|nr:YkgJ family cysteine cluster protein [Archangium sp.]
MTEAAETLCQQCGMCCDGTLFHTVPLRAEDVLPAKLTVVTNARGARSFRQPCDALEGTCCTVYSERPYACRKYECMLLEALRSGEVSLSGAAEIVAQAKQLRMAANSREKLEAFLRFHFIGHRR